MAEVPLDTTFLYGFGAAYLIVLALYVHALLDRRPVLRGKRREGRMS
ncbi:MAG: hypothetical protein IT557_03215 [Alphaproteobacteria bacterium]|nr:hypothetical protein [Alphaproteobacteria bacterium]